MESYREHPDTAIRSSGSNLIRVDPLHGKHTSRSNILEGYILQRFCYTPDIYVSIQRTRRDVLTVRRPSE